MGARYAGESSPLALQNRLFLGEAQLAFCRRSRQPPAPHARDHARRRAHALPPGAPARPARRASRSPRSMPPKVILPRRGPGSSRSSPRCARPAQRPALPSRRRWSRSARTISRGGDAGAAVAACREAVQLRAVNWPQNWELAVARELTRRGPGRQRRERRSPALAGSKPRRLGAASSTPATTEVLRAHRALERFAGLDPASLLALTGTQRARARVADPLAWRLRAAARSGRAARRATQLAIEPGPRLQPVALRRPRQMPSAAAVSSSLSSL